MLTLRQELLEILAEALKPMSCKHMFSRSNMAVEAVEISREIRALKDMQLVAQTSMEGDTALYEITEAGRQALVTGTFHDSEDNGNPIEQPAQLRPTTEENSKQEPEEALPQGFHKAKERGERQAKKRKVASDKFKQHSQTSDGTAHAKDILTFVKKHQGIARNLLADQFTLPDKSNFKKVKDMVTYMIRYGSLRVEKDELDISHIYVGDKIIEKEKKAKAQQNKKRAMPVADQSKPKVLRILEYIEQHPGAGCGVIMAAADCASIDSSIQGYIKAGYVIKLKKAGDVRRYTLKEGWTAARIYETRRGGLLDPDRSELSTVSDPDNSMETKPGTEIGSQPDQLQPIAAGESPRQVFRVAYTSDGTLILFGITPQPIELSKPDTAMLGEFISKQPSLVKS